MVAHAKTQSNTFSKRLTVLAVFLVLLMLLILFRLFSIQVLHGAENRKLAENQHSIYKKLLPSRGEIKLIDQSTLEPTLLATNVKQYLVYAVPQEIETPQLTAESLAGVLNMSAQDVLGKLTQKDRKYVPIKKKLTDDEQNKIKALKLSGIYFDSEDSRIYPEQSLLSQTLGFLGYKVDTKEGLYGLEKFYEKDLAGSAGSLTQDTDPGGSWIFGSSRALDEPLDGKNIILTVDKSIQFKAESVLKDTVDKNGADSGSVVVMNPKTGAILAIAGYPDFNPNEYNKVTDPKVFLNEAATGNYEPGSVFKAITMAAAVDEGKVGPDTTYNDTGSITVDGFTIKNSDTKAHGIQTMTQVLDESLNTGAIFAKNSIGNKDFLRYVQNFGFGAKTGIELPETKGDLSGLNGNIEVKYYTSSFGQGLSVTPLQLVAAYGALANGGKLMKPYLVQSIVDANGHSVETQPQMVRQVISEKTASTLGAMLVSVVENGHGKKAGVPGFYIAGKTGTAQVPSKDKKGYEQNNNIGSFAGFGPVENPQFVMVVRIDHPRDVNFAESTAAPAWGQLAEFILNYYHISPTRK